ncbi:SPT3 Dosage dependent suppressor of Ty-induced promoter mutations-like protein, partial [Kickxella alabastrina]
MFSNPNSPFAHPASSVGISTGSIPSMSINSVSSMPAQAHPVNILSRQTYPVASTEFLQRVEDTKAKGLTMTVDGIPHENAKSRVETQIKITLRLTTDDNNERATCWSHLSLPEHLVSREKFRHRMQKHMPGDTGMPLTPQHVVHLEASVICSSDPTRKVETCLGCIRREYKRSLRRKDARLRSAAPSTCTTPAQSRPGSPTMEPQGRFTGTMESDWDEARIAMERQRIVIFNCNDLLDFSKGEVVLPTRITCYCRHHNEKVGFCVCLKLRDSQGNELATLMSAPIMITDDHKSTKFKTERKTRTKAEYERQGDGNAAYANHALAGLGSPHGSSLHLGEAPGVFKGGRQALSARNSPTLRPYSHHHLLDTYSQFASLAGTPSLGNTPIGSPLLSAAHISGFESPFHLPQSVMAGGNGTGNYGAGPSLFGQISGPQSAGGNATAAAAAAAAAMVANFNQQQALMPMSPIYGNMHGHHAPMNTLNLQQQQPLSAASTTVFGGDSVPSMLSHLSSGNCSVNSGNGAEQIVITQLAPAQGPLAGGTTVLISGRGFHPKMAVYVGGSQVARIQVLSSSNLACVLPPSKVLGPAAVRIRDLTTMTVYEGNGSISNLQQLGMTQPTQQSVFTYIEDTDQAMLELTLQIIGLKSGDKSAQASGGSPGMGPAGAQGKGSSPQSSRLTSPTPSGAHSASKIMQDPTAINILRSLRAASESCNLMEIEICLINLLMTLFNRGLVDPSRLCLRHEATGRLLVHFAALLGMLNLLLFLKNKGIPLDDTDNNGMTAMHFACMYGSQGRADIVEFLLNAGASCAIKSLFGQTPGDVARSLGHSQIQLMIEEREGYMSFIKEDPVAETAAEAEAAAAAAAVAAVSGDIMQPLSAGASDAYSGLDVSAAAAAAAAAVAAVNGMH